MSKINKEYSIFYHYKQGDDFRHFLDENGGNVSSALKDWGEAFKALSEAAIRLGTAIGDANVAAFADTHHISFEPTDSHAEGLMDVLVKEGMVDVYEFEDEDYEIPSEDDGA